MTTDFSKYQAKNSTAPSTSSNGVTDFSKYGAVSTNSPQPINITSEPNYFSRVASDYKQAGQNITNEISKASQPTDSIAGDTVRLGRTVLRGIGDIAGAAFSPIIQAPGIKQTLEYVGGKIKKIPSAEAAINGIKQIAEKYPEASKDVGAIVNIIGLGGGKAVEAPLLVEGKAIAIDLARGGKILLSPSEQAIQKNVIQLFTKSIKPTAKKTLAQGEKYQFQTLNALKTIKQNVDNLNIEDATGELISGRTPQTINELAQGVEQTKKIVFDQYDNLAKQANKLGATIDTKPVAEEVFKVSQNKALQITNPEVVDYALQWNKRLKDIGYLDAETTQSVIQNINNNLSAFYKNPTYESATKVAIDAGVVNNLRKSLDNAIENATGQEYQALKNQYSSLKAIENDVVKATLRDARKNLKGLLDYTDMFTSGQMLSGVLSLNPAMFTKGAVERGFKEYIKFINDPNRAIDNIFKQLNKTPASEFKPSSAIGKYLQ